MKNKRLKQIFHKLPLLSILAATGIIIVACHQDKKRADGKENITTASQDSIEVPKKTVPYEDGYKDFKWGDDIESVRKKVPDLEADLLNAPGRGLLSAYFYQNSSLYGSSFPDPLFEIERELSTYISEEKSMIFEFWNSKLISVGLRFAGEQVVDDLESKYGRLPSKTLVIGTTVQVKAWFNSNGRVITYMTFHEVEIVTYIDANVYESTAAKLKAERINENTKRQNKID